MRGGNRPRTVACPDSNPGAHGRGHGLRAPVGAPVTSLSLRPGAALHHHRPTGGLTATGVHLISGRSDLWPTLQGAGIGRSAEEANLCTSGHRLGLLQPRQPRVGVSRDQVCSLRQERLSASTMTAAVQRVTTTNNNNNEGGGGSGFFLSAPQGAQMNGAAGEGGPRGMCVEGAGARLLNSDLLPPSSRSFHKHKPRWAVVQML